MSRWIICPSCAASDKYREDCRTCDGSGILTGNEKKCSHGCGTRAGNDGYCDDCYADQCLIGPDGVCRYVYPNGVAT